MKKIFIVIVCIISVFFISGCGNKNEYERKMWGTWENIYVFELNGTYITTINTIYTIKKDGTFDYNWYNSKTNSEEKNGTYTIKDNIITLTLDEEVVILEYDDEKDIMYQLKDDVRTSTKYERK